MKRWPCLGIAIISLLIGACSPSGEGSMADLVIRNARVLTVDSNFAEAEAVAIRDGVFIEVGDNETVQNLIGEQTRVIDAGGKTVVPGLIESHVHAQSVVQREYATPHPFEQLGSIADMQRWLRTEVEKTPQDQWIQLPRVDVTRIKEGRIPNRADLDEAAPDHPALFIWQFASRQVQVLNTAAMEAAGITKNTPVQEGGEIVLDENGEPTGVLENCSELTSSYLIARTIPDQVYLDDLEQLLNSYNEVGITSIGERHSNPSGYHNYEKLKEEGRLTTRVTVTLGLSSDGTVEGTEKAIRALSIEPDEGDDWVRTGPLKLRVDGGILYGSAFMREPYGSKALSFYGFDNPEHRGELLIDQEKLNNMIHTGHRMGWQMSAHITGDAGVDAVLNAVEASQEILPDQDLRFTLIHGYFVNRETARRIAGLGVGVDTQPAWYYKDGDALSNVLVPDRMNEFIGLQEWVRSGARVAINSDHMYGFDPNSSLNPYNPFLTMYTAISRKTEGGKVINPGQKVSREDALRMMTIDAAWLNFDEPRTGSIEVGKLGDLAILTDDLLSCDEEQIKNIRSLLTVVGGHVVYEKEL
ncbi:MAG: amidohydrolase [Balneolales bacterium]